MRKNDLEGKKRSKEDTYLISRPSYMRKWERKYIALEEASEEAMVRENQMVDRVRMALLVGLVQNIPNRGNTVNRGIEGTNVGEQQKL